jgi:hypothetical protein
MKVGVISRLQSSWLWCHVVWQMSLLPLSYTLKMEATGSFETLVFIYQTAGRHTTVGCSLNIHC